MMPFRYGFNPEPRSARLLLLNAACSNFAACGNSF